MGIEQEMTEDLRMLLNKYSKLGYLGDICTRMISLGVAVCYRCLSNREAANKLIDAALKYGKDEKNITMITKDWPKE